MQKTNGHPFFPALISVLFLTLLSAGASLWLSSKNELSPQQDRMFNISVMTWQMGTITVFGLLGSRATNLNQSDSDEE